VNVRLTSVLDEAFAREALAAVSAQPHALSTPEEPPIRFQYWKWINRPEADCDHVLCRLGRLIHTDLRARAERLTGLALAPAPDGLLAATLFTKGSYLDAHDDFGRGRAIAYVRGLTPEPWPAEEGGGHEFLAEDRETALERRPPGWNTLDLFDVREPGRWHRVPILRAHRSRRAIAGWFHPR
jgi:hypothetical protein